MADEIVEDNTNDGEYVVEEWIECDEAEKKHKSTFLSYGMFVDFDKWIPQDGGFNKFLYMIM